MDKLLWGLIAAVIFFVLFVLAALLNGWVMSVLWFWYLVPLGLPPLGVLHSFGLLLVMAMLTRRPISKFAQQDDTEIIIQVLGYTYLGPLVLLGIGYCIHLLM